MKKLLLFAALLCSPFLLTPGFAKGHATHEQSLDNIVAIVNDDVITHSEYNSALDTAKIQIAQEHLVIPSETVLKKQVLDQLISKKLQMQIAKQAGIEVSDEELNQAIAHIAQLNNVTVASLYDHIKQSGISAARYRAEIREQMTLQRVAQQEVTGKITVTPQEITSFIHSKNWQDNESKEYHLEDVLIPVSDTPSSEEIVKAKSRATQIFAKLKQGQSFHDIVQSEPNQNPALQGGDLGFRKLPEIPTAFAEKVAGMKEKDLAGPIQTSNGFHIIRLVAVRNRGLSKVPSHKQIEDLLMQRKYEEAVQNWVSKLRSQAYIVMNP